MLAAFKSRIETVSKVSKLVSGGDEESGDEDTGEQKDEDDEDDADDFSWYLDSLFDFNVSSRTQKFVAK